MYKGCGESVRGEDRSMAYRRGSTPIYKGCGECLRGVNPSRIHHRGVYVNLQGLR